MHKVRKMSILWLGVLTLTAAVILPQDLSAHHGWDWAEDEEFVITGKIVGVRLGNPHGEVTIEAEGGRWVIEVGQPWRNESAGLTPDLLSPGTVITAHGHRSSRKGERLVKAERIVIDGRSYNLYPVRES
jgi:hypothetical protein